jgi:hypothetical protein
VETLSRPQSTSSTEDCRNIQSLRDETWLKATTTHEKLYGPVEELKRTTTFITTGALRV